MAEKEKAAAASLGAAFLTGGASLLPGLSSATSTATSAATSGAGAGAGAGVITFGETKTNWTTIALIAGLALVALVLAKKAA